ncbi:MAG: GPR endopeptidase [Lachnospiraceae bacterium]
MAQFQSRTDLALEAREFIEESPENSRGVVVEEYESEEGNIFITRVDVTTKNGECAMGKPMGTYITIEAPLLLEEEESYEKKVSLEISSQLLEIAPVFEKETSVLVVGLGNREVIADALGPKVVDLLYITRHLINEFGTAAFEHKKVQKVSAITPGVMANTGIESAEIIKGVVSSTNPDLLVVIDALAARSTKRLNRTIQITDTGIHPGSGVGNHRNAITKESIGIPVIAIGVPTVVDGGTIVNDAIEKISKEVKDPSLLEISRCIVVNDLNSMYVTSKDIDATIKKLSEILAEALNITFEHI